MVRGHKLLEKIEAHDAGALRIDLDRRLVTRSGAPERLSPEEYDLLARLVLGGGRVLTHRRGSSLRVLDARRR